MSPSDSALHGGEEELVQMSRGGVQLRTRANYGPIYQQTLGRMQTAS